MAPAEGEARVSGHACASLRKDQPHNETHQDQEDEEDAPEEPLVSDTSFSLHFGAPRPHREHRGEVFCAGGVDLVVGAGGAIAGARALVPLAFARGLLGRLESAREVRREFTIVARAAKSSIHSSFSTTSVSLRLQILYRASSSRARVGASSSSRTMSSGAASTTYSRSNAESPKTRSRRSPSRMSCSKYAFPHRMSKKTFGVLG